MLPAGPEDGRKWRARPQPRSHVFPAERRDGWFRDRRAAVHVRTRRAGVFGLLTRWHPSLALETVTANAADVLRLRLSLA